MRVNIVINCRPEVKNKAGYVLTTLLDTLGCPYRFADELDPVSSPGELYMVYGSSPAQPEFSGPILYLKADGGAFDSPRPLQNLLFEEKKIPILAETTSSDPSAGTALFFCSDSQGTRRPSVFELHRAAGSSIGVHFDLIASAFFFLSRREELSSRRDKHQRFAASEALAVKAGFASRPVVSVYAGFLRFLLLRLASQAGVLLVFKSFWPKGKRAAVCLTHDVDVLSGWFLYSLVRFAQLLKKGSFAEALRLLSQAAPKAFQPKYPLKLLRAMVQQEEKRNFRSVYFFLSGKPTWRRILKSDITYDHRSKPIATAIRELSSRGFEIGLHGSYDSFKDAPRLAEEKQRLEESAGHPILGIRQHFLRFAVPDSWLAQKEAGFAYDTTVGFAEQAGFRAGFSFPFFPYDLKRDEIIPLLELPLVVMDRTYSKYQSASNAEVAEGVKRILGVLKESGGLLTLLWHTHMADEFGFFGYPELYDKILEHIQKEGFYVGSGEDIYRWWMARKGFEVSEVRREGSKISWKFCSPANMENFFLEVALPGNPAAFSVAVTGAEALIQPREGGLEINLPMIEGGREVAVLVEKK